MTQRNWYRPPMGTESIDTTVLDWKYNNIYQYTYDESGNMLTRFDSLNWFADEYYEYTYNDANLCTSELHKTRELYHLEWNPNWKLTECFYGDKNQLIETVTSTRSGEDWVKGIKLEYIYYPNDSLQYEITYMWKTEGWLSFDSLEYIYEYNETDELSSVKSRLENWELAYHANGQIDSVFHEHFFSYQDWIKKYDVYGNLIANKILDSSNPSVTISKTEYYYEGFPTAVKEQEVGSIGIFPNPAGAVIQLVGDLNAWGEGAVEARIYNLNGQLVQSESVALKGDATIQVFHLSPGIYLLTVQLAHRYLKTKFVKY